MNESDKSVLFVCLGNICRSPLAEIIARAKFARAGLDLHVASAGTGDWHIGQGADARACAVAARHGYDLSSHRAQQVSVADFNRFDWLLGMDRSNVLHLLQMQPQGCRARIGLMLDVAGVGTPAEVPDPYFGGDDGFLTVLELLEGAIDGLTHQLSES
ncbi:MAG: low molecular weight protein-tyrosine-phosphatase [Rhodanobacteraceae bacterium]